MSKSKDNSVPQPPPHVVSILSAITPPQTSKNEISKEKIEEVKKELIQRRLITEEDMWPDEDIREVLKTKSVEQVEHIWTGQKGMILSRHQKFVSQFCK